MNTTAVKIAGGVGAAGAVATAAGVTTSATVVDGGVDLSNAKEKRFISEGDKNAVEKILGSLSECPMGFKRRDKKCEIPDRLTSPIRTGNLRIGKDIKDEEKCLESGYYWWRKIPEIGSNEGCHEINTVIRPLFEKEIELWGDSDKKLEPKTENSIKYFNSNGFWELKMEGNAYAMVIKEEKMVGNLENWDFPYHLISISGEKSAAIWDICFDLENLVDTGKEVYIYNQKRKTWWDCKENGRMYLVRNI